MKIAVIMAVSVLLSGGHLACSGRPTDRPSSTSDNGEQAAGEDSQPKGKKAKRYKSWRWRGSRDECFYVFDNRCFTKRDKACAAAKCPTDRCKIIGGGPATIECTDE